MRKKPSYVFSVLFVLMTTVSIETLASDDSSYFSVFIGYDQDSFNQRLLSVALRLHSQQEQIVCGSDKPNPRVNQLMRSSYNLAVKMYEDELFKNDPTQFAKNDKDPIMQGAGYLGGIFYKLVTLDIGNAFSDIKNLYLRIVELSAIKADLIKAADDFAFGLIKVFKLNIRGLEYMDEIYGLIEAPLKLCFPDAKCLVIPTTKENASRPDGENVLKPKGFSATQLPGYERNKFLKGLLRVGRFLQHHQREMFCGVGVRPSRQGDFMDSSFLLPVRLYEALVVNKDAAKLKDAEMQVAIESNRFGNGLAALVPIGEEFQDLDVFFDQIEYRLELLELMFRVQGQQSRKFALVN